MPGGRVPGPHHLGNVHQPKHLRLSVLLRLRGPSVGADDCGLDWDVTGPSK